MTELESQAAVVDLSAGVAVLTATPSATVPTLCQVLVYLGDADDPLDGTGGDFAVRVSVGDQAIQPAPQVLTVEAGATRAAVFTAQFPAPAAAEIVVSVLSPNAGDSAVAVTAYLYDTTPSAEVTVAGFTPAGATAANAVAWQQGTRTLTTPAAGEATPADTAGLTLYAGDTWSQSITGLGSVAGAKRIWLAVKRQRDGLDEDARVLLDNLTGLLRLNGVAAETAADGSLTVDDAAAGDVTLMLEAAATVALQAGKYVYGIKWLDGNDDCWTLAEGELLIVRRTVRAVTETDTESSSPGP